MTPNEVLQRSADAAAAGEPCVLVTLAEAIGSTPQDPGAKMLVGAAGRMCGTVGGGRVEARAIDHALAMLRGGAPACALVDWSLKADIGMTCGGRVRLVFERFAPPDWRIVIFGAGHVAQALTRLLVTLPCRVACVDPRREWLERLPERVEAIERPNPADYAEYLPEDAYVLCMTQGHRSDLPVLERLLRRDAPPPFVGVIGSRAKAAVLRKELTETGIAPERIVFHCPVGLPLGGNHPSEIAVSIAAQLLQTRDALGVTAAGAGSAGRPDSSAGRPG